MKRMTVAVEEGLWAQVKARAAVETVSLPECVSRALRAYVRTAAWSGSPAEDLSGGVQGTVDEGSAAAAGRAAAEPTGLDRLTAALAARGLAGTVKDLTPRQRVQRQTIEREHYTRWPEDAPQEDPS